MGDASGSGAGEPKKGVPYFDGAQTVQAHEEEEKRKRDARFNTQFLTRNLKRSRMKERVVVAALVAALLIAVAIVLSRPRGDRSGDASAGDPAAAKTQQEAAPFGTRAGEVDKTSR